MSNPEPTDDNPKQKSEKRFLTLADKKPSLARFSGNQSTSAMTISTRQLSDHLQRTRDTTETDGIDGSVDEKERRKRGQLMGEFHSEEFVANGNPNINLLSQNFKSGGGLKDEMLKNGKSERGKNYFGSDMSSTIYRKRFGQFFNKNDKRFKSQNPKKDGPLSTRILIDAFFPSLEGNRIFPVFNYRCAEKIDRTSTERNRKRLNNQLVPVSSSTPIQEVEDESGETSTEQRVGGADDVQNVEKILKVKEYQNEDGSKKVAMSKSQKAEELQQLNQAEAFDQQQKGGKMQEVQQRIESQEVVRIHDRQQVQERHKVDVLEETLEANSDRMNRTNAANDKSMVNNQNQSIIDETKDKLAQHGGHVTHQNEPLADEINLMQKVLRTLMENEELVDFICEKVIAKIAARNDFCGPNCQGRCGGLNDPSKVQ